MQDKMQVEQASKEQTQEEPEKAVELQELTVQDASADEATEKTTAEALPRIAAAAELPMKSSCGHQILTLHDACTEPAWAQQHSPPHDIFEIEDITADLPA